MKIGFVLDDSLDKADGVQQYILTLGRWYTTLGHQVHYLVGQTRRTDIPHVHSLSHNLSVRFNQNRMSTPFPASGRKIQKLLDTEQFDVLHVQVPYSPFLAAKIIKRAPALTAIIGTFHVVPFSRLQSLSARLLGLYLFHNSRRFDKLVGASRPAAKFARKTFHIKAPVVTNTVDTALFSGGKKMTKYDDGKINIVFLGRLVERKGCQQLLEALSLLHDKHQLGNVRVIICGKGPLLPSLEAYVETHHLGSIVHFVGFINEADKPDYLASAHLAVFPSLGGECFGIVLIEAMAGGSEVVLGGDNIGYRSVLGARPDQLFDPLNSVAFAATLKHFILSGQARKRAQRWQLNDVKQYDVVAVGKQLLDIYEAMIAKRSI
jgi:phosphatidylinositol alpha-mannosyltransferase